MKPKNLVVVPVLNIQMITKLSYLFLFFLISCDQQKTDTKAEAEKLMQLSREWSAAASSGNIDSILSYWAEDAIVMSPGQPTLYGKQAIRGMVESTTKIPGFKISWEPKTAVVSESGDFAYLTEENQITMNDSLGKAVTEYNKGVTVWKKDAKGNWKNVVDIWNAKPAPYIK